MKYIIIFFMLIATSLETNATLEPLELILQLKSEGRKAEDEFPELRPLFEQKSQMIRAKIEHEDLRTLFDECHAFAQNEFDQRGLTLYSNMMIHMMYASILTFQQKQGETAKDNTALIEAIDIFFEKHNLNDKNIFSRSEFENYIIHSKCGPDFAVEDFKEVRKNLDNFTKSTKAFEEAVLNLKSKTDATIEGFDELIQALDSFPKNKNTFGQYILNLKSNPEFKIEDLEKLIQIFANSFSKTKSKEAFEQYVAGLKSKPALKLEDLKDLIQAFKGLFDNKKLDGTLNAYPMKTIDNCRIGALRGSFVRSHASCWSDLMNNDYTDFRRTELVAAKTFFGSEETDEEFCQNHSVCFWHVMPEAFKNITAQYEKLFGSFFSDIPSFYFAETAQLYYLPIVSETGILEINDLNKAVANAIGLVGISLNRTNYDGGVNETTLSTASHDVTHAEGLVGNGFTAYEGSRIDPDRFCTVLMNFYSQCNQIHQKIIKNKPNLSTQQKSEDQLVFFFVGHENGLSKYGCDKGYITRAEFCKAVDSASSLPLGAVKRLQSTRSKETSYQGYIPYFLGDNLGEFNLVLNLPEPRFRPKSFVEFVQKANAEGANIPLDQPLSFERSPENDQRFSYKGYHAFDFTDYNLLLDYINMLPGEIDSQLLEFENIIPPETKFQLWEEDGEIDFLKIKRSFKRIFEDFKNRYKDQFPED